MNTESNNTLAEIGAELAASRNGRGLSIQDVSQQLRIQAEFIDAIEKGNPGPLPAMPYVLGYIRSYGTFLGLPANAMCQKLRASLEVDEIRPDYEFVQNKLHKHNGAGRTAFAALVACVIAYGGWYVWDSGMMETAGETATVQLAEQNSPDQDEGTAAEPTFIAVEPRAVATASEETVPAATAPLEQPVADNAAVPAVAAPEEDQVAVATEAAPAPEKVVTSSSDAVAHNRNPSSELILKASATSWVEITRPDGSIVSAWLMREGDEYAIPGDQDIYLTTGNAGGLQIDVGDGELRLLGDWGETLSELPLDPSLLADRL